ncbi:expressed unknown protein [Seminavis robusta]|uniref:Uncharacterized protein n=1 Tax=Seminavis robusta TaxID=568900 RepID=A0A9N8D9J7_9STRA|nr:expressed unknown protein [Seminavis robusta]|eukprot:Sro42_g025511.1  (438) ;mRNA; r:39539-40852
MDSYLSELSHVARYNINDEEWTPASIIVNVATSLADDTPKEINIMDTLGFDNYRMEKSTVYWLPSMYQSCDPAHIKEVLMPYFVLPCKTAGFRIKNKGFDKRRNHITICCPRSRFYKQRSQKDSNKTTQTQLPVEGEGVKCPFSFNVLYSQEHRRWYLPKFQTGNKLHRGHVQLEEAQVKVLSTHLGTEAVTLAEQCLKNHLSPSVVKTLLYERTGSSLTSKQIESLRKSLHQGVVLSLVKPDGTISQVPHQEATAADRLLARLQSDPTKSFVVLFASYDSGLLRIRQSHRGATPQNIDPESLTDESDSAESFANKVRDALSITGSGMILLALAWTGESSQRLFQMYPEFKSGDITYKTNSEKRELHIESGIAADGQSFSHTWALFPCASKWIFQWFYRNAMPRLHSAKTLSRVEVAAYDEDEKCYMMFQQALVTKC